MSKKRQDLINHAERLFYENGFHSVGLKKIITEADVALMTMYNHFTSKEELILEVLKYRELRYFSLLKELVEKNTNSKTTALLLAEGHMTWIRNHKNGCMFLRAKEEYPSEESEINQYVITHKKSLLTFLKNYNLNHQEAIRLTISLEGATSLSEVLPVEEVSQELMFTVNNLFLK
ncbi:TetR/AcrR family transcriptional regulator [Salipaludibacillus agaradhaerens]|uniref:TetR/AcrR family transcriptional regulator n=1 Tax=Salipaludibacillus agaradhaerens TaxID=76935 RepID=UPI0009984DB5|nr:TetR/AcrR family transcriptional regulator [Salipaludibacillus agaradhaerens]